MRDTWTPLVSLLLLLLLAGPAAAQDGIDLELLEGMEARSIGPAGMSGRIAAIDAVVADPDVIYVGAATGGVWRSDNGGTTWTPIFDDQPVAAIGAVAVFQPSPDILWVGTGEGNPRNSVSVGNGVYRSMDGGDTWEHLGLEDSERIHRILLHPSDPDVAWVAAMGRAWGENEQRGVFRTTDGGDTWEKLLYVNERTGAADLVMDPTNPNKLMAAMWEYRRWPHFFKSGGEGSGLWVSHDGGDTWQRRGPEDGLPRGELGRIGLAIAPSDPRVVYALVEAEDNVLLRSIDGGRTFSVVNDDTGVSPRPFYYADLRVDPERPDRVYRLAGSVTVSDDGGRSFGPLGGPGWVVHPDHHALWIHPDDATLLIDGNDGGIAISRDRGATWQFVRNLPLAQYYHVAVDMEVPYNVYGGLQDNGSWRGPSAVWEGGFFGGGIRNFHWQMVFFGDGFDTRPLIDDGEVGYAMSQGGNLARWNLRTGETRSIRPPAPEDVELRFNWNAGLALDPFDRDVVYYGSQFVHRSADQGSSWETISPDLTTDEAEWQRQEESGGLTLDVTAAENYTTIVAIVPSPLEEGTLWVGTDDGRLHLTRDGGGSWTSLEERLAGVPAHTWIPDLEASPHDPATAFVVLDDHRRSNWTPYVYRTDDYGETWRSLVTDDIRGYALSIVQDPVEPDLLFLGTEFGLWVSLDGGGSWLQWTHGLPTVGMRDLAIHPREHDLVIGTHGRAIYILDDIRPLRELAGGALAEPLHLYEPAPAQQYASMASPGELMPGSAEFMGQNRPYGALITYSVGPEPEEGGEDDQEASPDDEEAAVTGPEEGRRGGPPGTGARGPGEAGVEIEILDADGDEVRTLEGAASEGLHRVAWDLRRDPFRPGQGGFFGSGGPEVPAGDYTVVVRKGDDRVEGPLEVRPDPRSQVSQADRRAKWEAILEVGEMQRVGGEAVDRLVATRKDVDAIVGRAREAMEAAEEEPGDDDAGAGAPEDDVDYGAIVDLGDEVRGRLDEVERLFRTPPDTKGITGDDPALSKVGSALGRLTGTWAPPSPGDRAFIAEGREALAAAVDALNALMEEEVAELRRLAREARIELLPEAEPLVLPGQ